VLADRGLNKIYSKVFSHSSLHLTSDLVLPHYISQGNCDSSVCILTSAKVKNEWSYTSTLPYTFMVQTGAALLFNFCMPQDNYICLEAC